MTTARLGGVTLDCDDVSELIQFYSAVTGIAVGFESPGFAAINMGNVWLTANYVEHHVAPTWPDATVPKQMHLEFSVSDLDASERTVLSLGARKCTTQPNAESWRVFSDPAGHLFCLTTLIPD